MDAKKVVIPIVVAVVVACGVGYYSYNIVKASTVSENTINSSTSSNVNTENSEQSNVASASNSNINRTNANSDKVVSSINSNDSVTASTTKNVASSTSNNNINNVESTTKTENTTSKMTQNTGSSSSTKATQSNSGTKTSNTNSSSNMNPAVVNYIGIWSPSIEALWDEDFTKNIIPTQSQLNESKIILTESEYSFGDVQIKNPEYIIVKRTSSYIFGNMRMGNYCPTNNEQTQAYGKEGYPNSNLEFIVAVPQGVTSSYINEVIQGFNILNYPYIVNGHLYAMLSSSENPIYEFSR